MKDYILLLRANSEMPKEAFNDPKELELRSKWISNMQKLDIISNLISPDNYERLKIILVYTGEINLSEISEKIRDLNPALSLDTS